jgi:hypothetical protein
LERAKNRLETDIEIQTRKLQELKLKTKEAEGEKSQLDRGTTVTILPEKSNM